MTIGAILLAAGASRRMRDGNKLLMDYQGKPLIHHPLEALKESRTPCLVICGHQAPEVEACVKACDPQAICQTTSDYHLGLSHSLGFGLQHAPKDWVACFVVLADMPDLDPVLLTRMKVLLRKQVAIVYPVRQGRRGNPVLWHRDLWQELIAVDGDRGGRDLIRHYDQKQGEKHTCACPWNDDGIFHDIDQPQDFQKRCSLFRG